VFRLALTHRDQLSAFAQVRGSPFDSHRPGSMHRSCFGTKRPPVERPRFITQRRQRDWAGRKPVLPRH
jgi:hypothetical protein